MMRNKSLIFLAAALMIFTGCSKQEEEVQYTGDETILSVDGATLSYAEASTYKRIMQAETYSYLQQFSTVDELDVWAEELMDDNPEYTNYGEQFDAGFFETVQELLLTKVHSEEYGVELTEEDKEDYASAVKMFLKNTPDEVLDVICADEESITNVLELLAINAKVKSCIIQEATPSVTDEEARQVGFEYVTILDSSYDDPEGTAQELMDTAQETGDLETAAGDNLSYQSASYTAADPEYDDFPEGLIACLTGMEVGDYKLYVDSDGNAYVLHLTTECDEEATESKRKTLLSGKLDEAYEEKIAAWTEEADIISDSAAWESLEATNDTIFEAVTTYDDDTVNGGTISAGTSDETDDEGAAASETETSGSSVTIDGGDSTLDIDITTSDGGTAEATITQEEETGTEVTK